MVGFIDRLNLSLALPAIAHDFGWTTAQVGSYGGELLSVFFVGYGLSNIFLTPVAVRLGPRRSLLFIVLFFSAFSALGAPASTSLLLFGSTRLLMGLGEGPHFPMMATLTKAWFPAHERSRANGLWIGGAVVATVITPLIVIPVITHFGWRIMLVAVGSTGMVVTLPVMWLAVYDTPAQAPWLASAEAERLRHVDPEEPTGRGYFFLKTPAFWVLLLAGSLNNFCAFGALNWLPTYFTQGRHLEFEKLRFAASVPYAFGVFGVAAAAWLGDRLQRRALVAAVGFVGTAAMIYRAASTTTIAATIAAFAMAVFFQSAYTPQEFAFLQRILPADSVGRGAGIYNGVALLVGGGMGTLVVGRVVSATGSYTAGIFTLVVAALLAAVTLGVLSRLIKY
jgi:sugar phosphate permease